MATSGGDAIGGVGGTDNSGNNVKSVLEQWAVERKEEAVALRREVGDLKKKKHLMMVMMNGKEGKKEDRIGDEVMRLAEREHHKTLAMADKMKKKAKSSYQQMQPIHVEF